MSFVLFATVAALAAGTLGAWSSWRRRDQTTSAPAQSALTPTEEPALERLPLRLGDVVSVERAASHGPALREERWLSGALILREGREVLGVVFVAPEAKRDDAVAVFAPPRRDIAWLSPSEIELGPARAEVPTTIEVEGIVLSLLSRLPVRVERVGRGAPRLGNASVFAIYEGPGSAVAVVLRGPEATCSWFGVLIEPDDYDCMGKGELP